MNAATPLYTATYTCISGFGVRGSGLIACLSSGWEAAPQCVKGKSSLFHIYYIRWTYFECAYIIAAQLSTDKKAFIGTRSPIAKVMR